MKLKHFWILPAILILASCTNTQDPEGNRYETLAHDLDTVWAIDFLPGGTLIFTERPGRVGIIREGKTQVIGEISAEEISESGLMGIAVDPNFEENKYIYLAYTAIDGNRVSRYTLDDTLKDETVILQNIPRARFHDGGRLKFGPDGKIYLTTGDATIPPTAQDLNSLSGKILRINKDGSIPEDNQYQNYVYSYGHRNSQGLAWHPKNNQLYASEHGPIRHDEINIIEPGKNYGWPNQCNEQTPETNEPLKCITDDTLAPAGMAFHKNKLYIAGLRGEQVKEYTLNEDGTKIISERAIHTNLGRIRDVAVKDGYLYIATSNRDGRALPKQGDDKILRIKIQ